MNNINYLIKNLEGINNISNLKMNFYYDETNNIRKLYLSNKYEYFINNSRIPFILGGIATYEDISDESIETLFKKLNIQKNQKEIKFDNIAWGKEFKKILSSKKLLSILEWIDKENLFIHAYILDIFFWSILDILEEGVDVELFYHNNPDIVDPFPLAHLKSILLEVLVKYKKEFFRELFSIGYPDITKNNKDDLLLIIRNYIYRYKNNNIKIKKDRIKLLDLLETSLFEIEKNSDFFLLQGDKNILIDKFDSFYHARVKSFPNSFHIFDEEKSVMESFETIWKSYNNDNNNYLFQKSEENKLIQISDVLVGFLRRLFEYLSSIDINSIPEIVTNLSTENIKLLKLFYSIYDKSASIDAKIIMYTGSIFEWQKFEELKSQISIRNNIEN